MTKNNDRTQSNDFLSIAMVMATVARILTLTSLWNIQPVASFSIVQSRSIAIALCRQVNKKNSNHQGIIRAMSSTSSSSLPDEDGPSIEEIKPAVRRSPRKAASLSSSTPNDGMEMLEKWIQHDDHSYYLDVLSPPQAYRIRKALVEWYRLNRRKLPWRGDPGPYDGSTAGFGSAAAVSGGKTTAGKKRKDEGNDIRSFFAGNSLSNKKKRRSGESTVANNQSRGKEKDRKAEDAPREVTAYGVWVSEIMLQQTRVEAVIPYYLKWMQSFPTVHSLANATEEEVNSHWAGLGFYRRARFLHAGAQRVVKDYDGIVPNTVEELMKVDGIGRYTASAVASIAYGVEVPVVDGNVCRVLSRLAGIANHIKAPALKDDLGWTLAERIVKAKSCSDGKVADTSHESIGSPGEVNQALMELGATYCSPSGSGIDNDDPLKDFYISTQLGIATGQAMQSSSDMARVESLIANQASIGKEKGKQCRLVDPNGISIAFYNIIDRINEDLSNGSKANRTKIYAIAGHASLPIPPPKKSKREEVIAVAVLSLQTPDNERCWLMVKRPSKGLLAGQWEFPSVCVWNSADEGDQEKKKTKKEGKKSPGKSVVVEVPIIDPAVRSYALDSFLSDMVHSDGHSLSINLNKRSQAKDEPVVHIFSHVRHTMWVEYGEVEADENQMLSLKNWKLDNGQEVGWMTESDMATVGITSGVRKVLAKASMRKKSKYFK